MPAKPTFPTKQITLKQSAKLCEVQPTAEELRQAEAVLRDSSDKGKKERSAMASMTQYVRANGDAEALGSRGEQRKAFMLSYLVLQARNKRAKLESSTKRAISNTTADQSTRGWVSYHYMVTKFGAERVEHLLTASKLKTRPCPLTGATSKELCDYEYCQEWEIATSSDNVAEEFSDSRVGDAKSYERIESMFNKVEKDDEGASLIKQEGEMSAEQILQEKISALQADGKGNLAKYQGIHTELKSIKKSALGKPYVEEFLRDLDKLVVKVAKSLKMLDAIATGVAGTDYDATKLGGRIDALEEPEKEYKEFVAHAKRFGVSVAETKRGAKRRSSA